MDRRISTSWIVINQMSIVCLSFLLSLGATRNTRFDQDAPQFAEGSSGYTPAAATIEGGGEERHCR